MKLHPEDPRLTAWLLGELSAADAAAVERAVAADPALGLAVAELEKTQRFLVDALSPGKCELLPRQRDLILQAARESDRGRTVSTEVGRRKRNLPWLFPLAAAAVLTIAAIGLLNLPSAEPKTAQPDNKHTPADGTLPMEVALMPAPGPPDAGRNAEGPRPTASGGINAAADARARLLEENGDLFLRKVAERLAESPVPAENALPPLVRRSSVSATDHPELALPVHAGRSSLAWITRSIRGDKKRPSANAVRLEEILNHFSLRPAGAASVSRGVTLSTETISCPWKPSSTLLLVSFRGAADTSREVTASFKANAASIRSYRLLGFAPVTGQTDDKLPSRLPAKSITSLVIEIEPAAPSANIGSIEWTVGGQSAPAVSLVRQSDAEPSNDARFAALVCTFAQWLTAETGSIIDSELLAALARECASDTMPADRTDFLNLIDQTLGL
jgi:hypothetical protein